MSTEEQKQAARKNIKRAQQARIKAAAKRYDVEVEASDWRDLSSSGKARKR